MPKENTHVFLAHAILSTIEDHEIRHTLSAQLAPFLLGSIIPDTMYYSPHASVSDTLHGKDGNPTNFLLPDMLGPAGSNRDLAFGCGYLTHCALDIVFHPVVYYLSGNYYDPDPHKRAHAVYMHRHIETCLDVRLANPHRIHSLLHPTLLKGLAFEEALARRFSIPVPAIRQALRKQLRYSRLFSSPLAFRLMHTLNRLAIVKDGTSLGLFYGNCHIEPDPLDETITFRDLITGAEQMQSIPALIQTASAKAHTMIRHAWAYAHGDINADDLRQAIPGESLDTGRLHAPVTDIRFTQG